MMDTMITLDEKSQQELLQRLRRLEGQVRGLQKMIEEGRECEEVVTQLAAAKAAFEQVSFMFISTHLRTCLYQNNNLAPDIEPTIEKAVKLFLRLT